MADFEPIYIDNIYVWFDFVETVLVYLEITEDYTQVAAAETRHRATAFSNLTITDDRSRMETPKNSLDSDVLDLIEDVFHRAWLC